MEVTRIEDLTPAMARNWLGTVNDNLNHPYWHRDSALHAESVETYGKVLEISQRNLTMKDGTPLAVPETVTVGPGDLRGLGDSRMLLTPNAVFAIEKAEAYEKEQADKTEESTGVVSVGGGGFVSGSQSNWAGDNNFVRARK